MEILDRVYNTFANLDRDFAKSKKSRSAFIIDKFGGDLDMGSMIILDAISASKGDETPEDIEKLTFVKDIFEKIMNARDNLDSLHDFSFGAEDEYKAFVSLLSESMAAGTGVRPITQAELNKKDKGAIHFISTVNGTLFCPVHAGRVLHIFNENMERLCLRLYPQATFEIGEYYERKSTLNVTPLKEGQLNKALR